MKKEESEELMHREESFYFLSLVEECVEGLLIYSLCNPSLTLMTFRLQILTHVEVREPIKSLYLPKLEFLC